MDAETQSFDDSGRMTHVLRSILPWLALAAVVGALWSIASGFTAAQRNANLAAQAAAAASSTANATSTASVTASGTAYVAKVQNEVALMSRPDAKSQKLATAKPGATLTVLESQAQWMRVKDAAGHIGWIPNDKRYITLQAK
jgi:SH3-like domain-containing protein